MNLDDAKKQEQHTEKTSTEGESEDSTRLLFQNAPKVPGVETGVFFRKVFKGKDKKLKDK